MSDLTTTLLPVMEQFYTLQGEGYYTGQAAYFIRLAGCDVGCHWCDVKESWYKEEHPLLSIASLITEAKKNAAKIIVITGGEPLMHDLTLLTQALKQEGFQLHIETSGVYPITGTWDWICVSPKKFKEPLVSVLSQAHELKPVIFHTSDLQWAQGFVKNVNKNTKLYLQPEWSKHDVILPELVNYVKANPQWQVSLQTHKYMNIP
jgi:7-carboxy-7-deazaguanine synthase